MKMTQKYTLELTKKELNAIYYWMNYADNSGDSPFMTEDKDIKALVKKLVEAYDRFVIRRTANEDNSGDSPFMTEDKDIKALDKKIAKEYLEGCPYLRNIKKEQTEWTKRWDNFCPRGESVAYFVPDNEENE